MYIINFGNDVYTHYYNTSIKVLLMSYDGIPKNASEYKCRA